LPAGAIACLGSPDSTTLEKVRSEYPALLSQTLGGGRRPSWVPVSWVHPGQSRLLWVADAVDIGDALRTIDAYRAAGTPVIAEERNIRLLPHLGCNVVLARGADEMAVTQRVLYQHTLA